MLLRYGDFSIFQNGGRPGLSCRPTNAANADNLQLRDVAMATIFERPFVKRFPYAIGPLCCLSVLSVTLLYCGQTVGWIKMKIGTQVGLGPGHIVLDRDPACPSPKGHSPKFSAHIFCDKMAGWIKVPLIKEVGFGPGDFVLHGDPAPPPERGTELPPQVSAHVHCGQMAEWIKMAVGMEVALGPGHIVLDGDQLRSQKRRQSPQFSANFYCG